MEGKDGRFRIMNITVPLDVFNIIREQKYQRQTTYGEVITNAIIHTYTDHDPEEEE